MGSGRPTGVAGLSSFEYLWRRVIPPSSFSHSLMARTFPWATILRLSSRDMASMLSHHKAR